MTPYYEQDGVTIYHGDSEMVLPSLAGVDLFLTDPPYNVSARGVGGRANTSVGAVPRKDGTMREIVRDYGDWDHGWKPDMAIASMRDALKVSGSLVAFTSEFLVSAYLNSGLDHRGLLFWRKTNPAPSFRKQIVRAIEFAVWQTKGGGWTFNAGGYCPNIWEAPIINGYTCENTNEQRWHPTQKPEAIIKSWVALFSNAGDLVVDPFMGSGTTIACAKRLNRRAIGIELDEKYCEIAAKRLQQGALPLEMGV
jgi:site-specific DNA-methyltransferase (adenine-specific)